MKHDRMKCILFVLAMSFNAVGAMAVEKDAVEQDVIGRPVRVVSISFPNGRSIDEVVALTEKEAAKGCDLLVLPETWRGNLAEDTTEGPALPLFAEIARKYKTYLVCPLDRMDGEIRLNTAYVLDRQGQIAAEYNKYYPFWSEFDPEKKVTPGDRAVVFDADFGKVGLAICFDANFPNLWQAMADQGAEIVVFPSAYSAGTQLQAHALNNHYYIVSSTQQSDCVVYDISGEELLYEKSSDLNISRITLDLDRGIYHIDFNTKGRDKLLKELNDKVVLDRYLKREAWFVLKANAPNVSARELARKYGLEELRHYKKRSRDSIDKMRGKSR